MKYVIWVAIIFAGLWWIRQQRSGANAPSKKKQGLERHATLCALWLAHT